MIFITLMYVTAIMAMSGPVDLSVLTLQATHRSIAAWEGSTAQLVTHPPVRKTKGAGGCSVTNFVYSYMI